MTTQVTITHSQPQYPAKIKVDVVSSDGKDSMEHAVLTYGESTVVHLHGGQYAKVSEVK